MQPLEVNSTILIQVLQEKLAQAVQQNAMLEAALHGVSQEVMTLKEQLEQLAQELSSNGVDHAEKEGSSQDN